MGPVANRKVTKPSPHGRKRPREASFVVRFGSSIVIWVSMCLKSLLQKRSITWRTSVAGLDVAGSRPSRYFLSSPLHRSNSRCSPKQRISQDLPHRLYSAESNFFTASLHQACPYSTRRRTQWSWSIESVSPGSSRVEIASSMLHELRPDRAKVSSYWDSDSEHCLNRKSIERPRHLKSNLFLQFAISKRRFL